MSAFEVMTREEWVESGAGSGARQGEYSTILGQFVESGERFARINTDPQGSGRFAGKKASSISTSLKGARDGKNPPAGVGENIVITSKNGVVYLENTAVEAEA